MNKSTLLFLWVVCVGLSVVQVSYGDDWPHWRGMDRNGTSRELSGYANGAWPISESWRMKVGVGASSPLIVGNNVYVMGWSDGKDQLQCIDALDAKVRWNASYDSPRYGRHATGDQSFYEGVSATPEYDAATGMMYTLGTDGELRCWNSQDKGSLVWRFNLYDKYQIPQRPQITRRPGTLRDYGYTTAPLLLGDAIIVEAGSPQHGNLLAFHKLTGQPLWQSSNLQPAGHSGGPMPITIDGVACIASFTARSLLVVRTDEGHAGQTVAEHLWETDFANNIAGPTIQGDRVIFSSKYNKMRTVCLRVTLDGIEPVWESRSATGVCPPVVLHDRVYFANRGLHCVDLNTGEVLWTDGRFGDSASCIVTGDDRLIVWANDGDLSLVEHDQRAEGEYKLLGEHRGILKDMAWPHVALANGRLYCKDRAGNLVCMTIAAAKK